MAELDLIIRNGTIVTASDTVRCDVGMKDGPNCRAGQKS